MECLRGQGLGPGGTSFDCCPSQLTAGIPVGHLCRTGNGGECFKKWWSGQPRQHNFETKYSRNFATFTYVGHKV